VLKNIYYKNLNYQIKNIHLSFKWVNIKKLIILGLKDIKIIRNITTLIERNFIFSDTKKKNKSFNLPCCFGKYQYTYENDKGKVSLVRFAGDFYGRSSWEIYCLEFYE
jgi:hypothetical protein